MAMEDDNFSTKGERSGKLPPNVEVKFDEKNMTLLLGLSKELVDPEVSAKLSEQEFEPKSELHMTAISFRKGNIIKKALKKLDETQRQIAIDAIRDFANNAEWDITPTGEFYAIEKSYDGEEMPRRSLVELVDCPQLAELYDKIRAMAPDLELDAPPAHITLGTQNHPQGIAINSVAELQQFGQPVQLH